ncbi:hypothetical protein BASA81_001125 [Batrachochytrium salamandrivorans]|nr:hypothetical protein BASA81_001125 [Batrachochytrium salamandrivorans]
MMGATIDTSGVFINRNASLGVSINFLLAIKHFNERRGDILPVLGQISACPHNLTAVAFTDYNNVPAKALSIMLNYSGEYEAILGLTSTTTATFSSVLATSLQVPIISNWATGPGLSNKRLFPYFSRTISSDGLVAEKVILLIKQLNISRFAMLYDEEQRDFKQVIETLCATHGLLLNSFSTPAVTNGIVDISNSLSTIASLQLNVIYIHDYERKVRNTYASAFVKAELLGKDKLLIFDDFDRTIDVEFRVPGSDIANFLAGSLVVQSTTADKQWYTKYLDRWAAGEFATPAYLTYLNAILPPYGNNSNYAGLGVRDTALNLQVDEAFFTQNTVQNAILVWGSTYDAAITLGLALCSSPVLVRGPELLARIRQTSFHGMSGPVSFDSNGDRLSANFDTSLINLNFDAVSSKVGTFNETTQQFDFIAPLTFRGGVQVFPITITPPYVDHHYLPEGLKILAIVLLGLLNLFCLVCLVWVAVYFSHKTVLGSQREFLVLFVLGCWLTSWSILPLAIDDQPGGWLNNLLSPDTACMLAPALYCVGFIFAMLVLCAKTIRMYRLFTARGKAKKHWLRTWKPLLGVFLFTMVDVALILAWNYVDPLIFVRIVTMVDKNDFPVASVGICATSTAPGLGFPSALCVYHIAVLIFLALFVQSTSDFPKEYQEAKYVLFMFTSLAQLYVLCIGMFIAVSTNVVGRFMVCVLFITLTVLIQLVFLFAPKMDQVRRNLLFQKWQFSSNDTLDVDFEDAIGNVHIQEKFAKFAERNLFVESVFFYLDAEEFHNSDPDCQSAKDLRRAEDLFDIYIKPGAIFQINISERCKDKVEMGLRTYLTKSGLGAAAVMAGSSRALSIQSPPPLGDVFLPAKAEIVHLLNTGGWKAFGRLFLLSLDLLR